MSVTSLSSSNPSQSSSASLKNIEGQFKSLSLSTKTAALAKVVLNPSDNNTTTSAQAFLNRIKPNMPFEEQLALIEKLYRNSNNS